MLQKFQVESTFSLFLLKCRHKYWQRNWLTREYIFFWLRLVRTGSSGVIKLVRISDKVDNSAGTGPSESE